MICADGLCSGQHFFRKAIQFAQFFGTFAKQRLNFLCLFPREKNGNRHGNGKDQNHGFGNNPHEIQRPQHGINAAEHLHQIRRKRRIYGIDVIGNAADNIAGGMGVKIGYRQGGQVFKQLFSHTVYDFLAELNHCPRKQIGQHRRRTITQQHFPEILHHDPHLNAAHGRNRVNGFAQIPGPQQRKIVGRHRQRQAQRGQRPMPQQIPQKPSQNAAARRFPGSIQRNSLPSETR